LRQPAQADRPGQPGQAEAAHFQEFAPGDAGFVSHSHFTSMKVQCLFKDSPLIVFELGKYIILICLNFNNDYQFVKSQIDVRHDQDGTEEYVDIRNDGGAAVDLAGWILRSEKGSQDCGLGGSIGAGQVLRIWAMAEDAGQGGFNCGFDSNIWNNSEPDPAILIDPTGQVVSTWN
jgi:hypothetical protein